MSSHGQLARVLGVRDAVIIGVGSMIGAGIFSAFTPAAAAAGSGLLVGLAIAAIVAYCNATSSAQLAVQYPHSGGTYLYGRERLGEWVGFTAGWSFVIGKTASCAAMAITFAAYAAPAGWERPVAVAAVLCLATINCFGITRTALLTRILVAVSLAALAVVVIGGLTGGGSSSGPVFADLFSAGWYGILESAGLLFFAFAGYARIATMGEEVRDPGRTIPRAIVTALAIALAVYVLVAITALLVLGPDRLAATTAPLVEVVTSGGWAPAAWIVRVGAATAALGALLALVAGIGRTSLAMARNNDLPRYLASVDQRFSVPRNAELTLAAIVCVLVLAVDLRGAIGFSSFGVLLYYFIANVAAFGQPTAHRRYPRALQVLGAVGCAVLVVALPPISSLCGVGVVAVGLVYRALVVARSRPRGSVG